jgi:hypothetical protein
MLDEVGREWGRLGFLNNEKRLFEHQTNTWHYLSLY